MSWGEQKLSQLQQQNLHEQLQASLRDPNMTDRDCGSLKLHFKKVVSSASLSFTENSAGLNPPYV